MEQKHTQVWLADYDSESDDGESSPIAITNDSYFFDMNEEDQVLVSNLYESRQDHDQTSCDSRQREEAYQEADVAAGKTNCSRVPIAESHQPANPGKRGRLNKEQIPESESQDNHQTSCAPHQREENVQKDDASQKNCPNDSSVANIASSHLPTKRTKYALEEDQLSPAMLSLLKQVKEFFVKPASLQRITTPVAQATILKALERVRCYLGFVARKTVTASHRLTDIAVFSDTDLIQSYLDYLHDVREVSPATTACHICSILYVLKYLHKEAAPKYDVAIINQLRGVATSLQRQGDIERPKTKRELKALNKWLSWEEILDAVELQRQKFDIARGKDKSMQMRDLLLLCIYCHLPPSRGLEIRTLRYFQETTDSKFILDNHKGLNVLVRHASNNYTFHFQDYKTKKYAGHDELLLELGTELNRLLTDYFANYRKPLLSEDSKDFVFVNSCGSPYTASCFTKHLQAIFVKLTGQAISINVLRSAFITYAYANANCSESMKDSLASALRHSRRQAQSVYDRRTMAEKKDEAVAFARDLAESSATTSVPCENDQTASAAIVDCEKFAPGDFVAVVEANSTLNNPKILIGRVMYFTKPGQEVALLHYRNIKANNYVLEVDGSCWTESVKSLVSVKMSLSTKVPDQYVLKISRRAIHKQVFSDS